ncbi:ribosomal RNA-processing protein 8-like [Uranotaenia lowii]|uniref:ribosomal RNA-processing protein 8-like n=1 Tax=Uranotaenia lowii TaxID=190385 RepID=UPI002478EE45|nr:ribosomal RNA-processing protein 8-like [Uranotaenia lowii]
MMDKIFKEYEWDDDKESSFNFAKQKVLKNPKNKNKSTREENGSEPGKFVRAPPPIEEQTESPEITNGKSKKRKRTLSEPTGAQPQNENGTKSKKGKKQKGTEKLNQSLPSKAAENGSPEIEKPSSFRDRLMDSLKGSRFRFLNEQLYRTTGEEARKMFQEDPGAFQAYHDGYRHQIAQWAMNPLDRIIKAFQKIPEDHIVADFGCGEARLAESIPHKVYSLDLVASNRSVIACNMANTPLETNSINVAVFCLSLMGTNLRDFLLEANRVLKTGGILKVAEVSSRFDNVKEFIDCVQKCGFLLENQDLKHKLFYFFNFKKVRTVEKASIKGKHFSLKPCLYKKR